PPLSTLSLHDALPISSCGTTARACSRRLTPAAGAPEAVPLVTHRGGCHCGAVAFEVDAPARLTASECNCSICRMSGYLHLIVPRDRKSTRLNSSHRTI